MDRLQVARGMARSRWARPRARPVDAARRSIVLLHQRLETPSSVAAAIGCDLFEVVNGELKFIGQLPTGNKVAYETTPGKKVFMAYGTAADFMLADLSPGKTYYWNRFERKNEQEKFERTLLPPDGQ